jgi:hypothetical protein
LKNLNSSMFHCHLIYSLEVWSGSGPSSSQLQP